ncbi:MAG TPA: hypothetical protein VGR35_06050 [Tepidisphaeraceae bacterium]|nr:hypothetical protein [Tepidisphaeraceae bacterium]
MPAIAPPLPPANVVTPYIVVTSAATSRDRYILHADGTIKAGEEAARAVRRFRRRSSATISSPASGFGRHGLLEPLTIEADLRMFAANEGIDFDALIAGAAMHFNAPAITRRTEPLSREELEFLFDDDTRAFER